MVDSLIRITDNQNMLGKLNPIKSVTNLDDWMDESVRRFADRQDRKWLQEARTQLKESGENKLDTFMKYFTKEHNYAVLDSTEEPLPPPNPKRPTYNSFYIPLIVPGCSLCVPVLYCVWNDVFQHNVPTNVIGVFCRIPDRNHICQG